MIKINISPALLIELQNVLTKYGYQLRSAVYNQKENNHRYIFSDDDIKLLIEFKK